VGDSDRDRGESGKAIGQERHSGTVPVAGESAGGRTSVTRRRVAPSVPGEVLERLGVMWQELPFVLYVQELGAQEDRWTSRSLAELLGHAPTPARAIASQRSTLLHPEDAARAPERIAALLETADGVPVRAEVRYRDVSGKYRWFLDETWVLDRSADGTPLTVFGCLREQSELMDLRARLTQAEKMIVLGRLVGGIAHDLNNVLQAVLGFSVLTAEQLAPEDPLVSDVEEIRTAAERAAVMTRRLLSFSRGEPHRPRPMDLRTVVDGVLPLLVRVVGPKYPIDVRHEGEAPAEIDPSEMEQVLLNLVINARDAMPDGGRIVVSTGSLDAPEAPSYDARGRFVLLAVEDCGVGMDESVRARAFEPFFTTKGDGTGLGLASVERIVREAGGSVEVDSWPGRGTRVVVKLPRSLRPIGSIAPPSLRRRADGCRALVVEDDPAVQHFMTVSLRRDGCQVVSVGSVKEALGELRAGPFDVVVADVVLPGGSGVELARTLARQGKRVPLILVSGHPLDAEESAAGSAFLVKPFTPADLAAAVERALEAG
jgi:signal transduction histidine kinase